MKIDYDPAKRETTLVTRRLDMADAGEIFEGPHLTMEDDRRDYGETRNLTVGFLEDRMVIISMRKANEREQKTYAPLLGG